MTPQYAGVDLRKASEAPFKCETVDTGLSLLVKIEDGVVLSFMKGIQQIYEVKLNDSSECHRCFEKSALDVMRKRLKLKDKGKKQGVSAFDERTDSWSAVQYFQFYSYLSQQQNMMQDYIRTATYQKAILANASADFAGKVVLDVGAGSGILSFFAIQAGAKRVYAVEASNMATHCNTLVQSNKLAGRIVVVSGKIEDIVLPEPVDVIISEPMGYMLYNERMLESYVHARKFLAPQHRRSHNRNKGDGQQPDSREDAVMREEGKSETDDEENTAAEPKSGVMFPSVAQLFVAPFSDEALFAEQHTKANFWYQQSFHGMDLSALRNAAIAEYFNQPVVDTFDIGLCPAVPCVHKVDFRTVKESELAEITIPLHFQIDQCATIHGLAFWFDVGFLGSQKDIWLSTAPTEPLTHWYQVRCLLGTTLFVQEGQILTGMVRMKANTRQSYDVDIELVIPGSDTKITNKLDLKNPHFRYTGYQPPPPPGSHTKPPTETYYANLQAAAAAAAAAVTVNSADGLSQVVQQQQQPQLFNGPAVATNTFIQSPGTPVVFSAGCVPHSGSATTGSIQLIHNPHQLVNTASVPSPTVDPLSSAAAAAAAAALASGDGINSGLTMSPVGLLSGANADLFTNGWPAGQKVVANSATILQPGQYPLQRPVSTQSSGNKLNCVSYDRA
ncbi:Histone-arginine methyltransferase carm1 [Sparganum proliferum]